MPKCFSKGEIQAFRHCLAMASPSPQLSPAFQLSSQGRSQEVYSLLCPGTVVGEDMEGEMILGLSFPAYRRRFPSRLALGRLSPCPQTWGLSSLTLLGKKAVTIVISALS